MEFKKQEIITKTIRISIENNGKEVGRGFLCLLKNDQHEEPFGLMEDILVDEECRGQGLGTKLVNELIAEAKRQGCYKLIAWSRHTKPKVHELYLKLGFKDWGKEFRMDFNTN